MARMLQAMPGNNAANLKRRVKAALVLTAASPDHVIQK